MWYTTTFDPGTPGNPNDDVTSVNLARYQTFAGNPNLADPASRRVLLTIAKPAGFTNHNGAKINFGSDGYLYVATGDGGSGGDPFNNAQNGNSLLGKMLRLAVTTDEVAPYYTIPGDNPYVADAAVRDEIWALGFRNPFRWSFDRATQDMWMGDVGQDAREEINYRAAGSTGSRNYGWRCYEGNLPFNTTGCGPMGDYAFPVHDYPNPAPGAAAVTGGYVYRGTEYPSLVGIYVATDYYSGTYYKIRQTSPGVFNVTTQAGENNIAAFGEAENGTLYALNLQDGVLYHIVATPATVPVNLLSFTVNTANSSNELQWKVSREINVKEYVVEYSLDGMNFSEAGRVPAKASTYYQFRHVTNVDRKIFYRLKMVDIDDAFKYSAIIISRAGRNDELVSIYPTVSSGQPIQVHLNSAFSSLKIFNMYGQMVHQQNPGNRTGVIYLDAKSLRTGTYTLLLEGEGTRAVQKFVIR